MLKRLKYACIGMLSGVAFCVAVVVYGFAIRWGDSMWGSPQGGLYVLAATIILGQGIWWACCPPSLLK